MAMNMQLGVNAKLEQNLSVQMLQSIGVLQMTTQELELAIKQEIEVNPMLEMADSDDDFGEDFEDEDYTRESDDSDGAEAGMINERSDINWDEYFEAGFGDYERPIKDLNQPDPEETEWKNQTKSSLNLQDKLLQQLREWKRPPEIKKLVAYLINSLDDRGYLQNTTQANIIGQSDSFKSPAILEAEDVIEGKLELENASYDVQEAFHVLHSLSPRGIGARNLRECLLIQAYSIPDFSPLAIKILEDHFEDLKALHYSTIAKAMDVSVDEVQAAVRRLSALSPHPGYLISDAPVAYVTPDLEVVEERNGQFRAILKRESRFSNRLRINQTYKRLLLDARTSKKDKEFIRERLNKANMFISNITHRETTLERVMNAIIKLQPDFFKLGPDHLRPMIQQEIADALDLKSISSISRTVNGKFVETSYGVFELRSFFTNAVMQEDGEDLSQQKILNALKELIDNEDKSKPLSDDALAKALEGRGITIARRTVAKYRENNLKILSARLRKQ